MKLVALIAAAGVVLAAAQASAQDGAVGEKVFAKCRACHQVGESAKSAIGPKLNGLFGRKAGTVGGFNYSDANKQSGVCGMKRALQATFRTRGSSCPAPRWCSSA
jgi:cytochrome c